MYVDYETLESADACLSGLDGFRKEYPRGAEALTILKENKFPIHFFHWAFTKFNPLLSEEEKQAYYDLTKIKNSKYVFNSEKINDSEYVNSSIGVDKSQFVHNSLKVMLSRGVLDGKGVTNSNNIIGSKHIIDSDHIISSNDVGDSKYIYHSVNINRSEYIGDSKNVIGCNFITFSDYVENCYGCFNLKNAANCIFCANLSNTDRKKYYIYNTEVTELAFRNFLTIINSFYTDEIETSFRVINNFDITNLVIAQNIPHPLFMTPFGFLPDDHEFIQMMKDAPNFDATIFTNLTNTTI